MDKNSNTGEFSSVLAGNRRFVSKNRDYPNLVHSQNPEYVVISCSDSRVAPSIILDAPLGTIFEIRLAGELIDDSAIASVEFAVEKLGTGKIIILGHTNCGAVNAAIEKITGKDTELNGTPYLEKAVHRIIEGLSKEDPARKDNTQLVKANIEVQKLALLKSPLLKHLHHKGEIIVRGAIYDLSTGYVEFI